MKHFFAEDMSMDELKEMVRRLRRKNDNSWIHLLVIVLGIVIVVGIVAAVVVKLTGCCGGGDCCCDDDCDCDEDDDEDEEGCQCANDEDFV